MSSPVASPSVVKKHKKHKSEKRERDEKPGLKLILKVGSQTTPEHDSTFDQSLPLPTEGLEETMQIEKNDQYFATTRTHHKKSKKKKKKKDKNKDREKKHKHHHKDKKRKREDNEEAEEMGVYPQIGSPGRELRTCVIKKLQERTPLSKGLDHLLTQLEKKDPQNFFAWPVTENIAPGYSTIISNPMDFSTMRQKIEENQYSNLDEFVNDFKLICNNAMKYNHVETVYYKASKKMLQAGLKIMVPEKLGWMLNLVPDITSEDVGFEITPELRAVKHHDDPEETDHVHESKRKMPATKFESIPDTLTPEEILSKSQIAARQAKAKLMMKRGGSSLGFLKQRKDGTTHLNILVGGDGVIPGTKKRPVLLGQLCGKLTEGSSQLQGFREDRRNIAKPVKPLYYGAFGSYAPSYDSAFSNLSKEESDLVYQTYGSDSAVQYAESVQDFVKDSDYATHLVDSLLDLLTGGDHSKTKKILEENKNLREEEVAVKTMLEVKPIDAVKVNVEELKSLQDLGIDVNFLDKMDEEIRVSEERNELQQRLDSMCQLLEKLQQTQYQRLSVTPPTNLNHCPPPSEEEHHIAENITESITEIAKRVTPGDIAPLPGIRKALGMSVPDVNTSQEVSNIDLESELRQFLESEPSLAQSPLRDDNTIEEILMA
ncbi:bromodomain containing 7/9 isoform X2 [Leptinotarsa decemlineata]|uniref:bromodomain containing 7/9 isoform X2 n=1 Tax=Leptinotarsa decemlineata TaxID=7539 RepID=UPI000C2520B5|nr:bromodomain-containing protein 7 isoform X2 [Leptinotarsa decemlineata]